MFWFFVLTCDQLDELVYGKVADRKKERGGKALGIDSMDFAPFRFTG